MFDRDRQQRFLPCSNSHAIHAHAMDPEDAAYLVICCAILLCSTRTHCNPYDDSNDMILEYTTVRLYICLMEPLVIGWALRKERPAD